MRAISQLEDTHQLDPTVAVGQRAARWIPPGRIRDALHGVWLGHPLHPVLVQMPIGMWLSASALDLLAPRADTAARRLVAAGLAASAPAIAAGAVDWSEQHEQQMRVGVVHALANSLAIGLYGASLIARKPRAARGLRLAGLAAVGLGGVIGGHISFRLAGGANHAEPIPHIVEPGWHHLATWDELPDGKPVRKMARWSAKCPLPPSAPAARYTFSPTAAATCLGRCPTANWLTAASPAPGTAAPSGLPTDPWPAAPRPRRNQPSRPAWSPGQSRSAFPAQAEVPASVCVAADGVGRARRGADIARWPARSSARRLSARTG
jgi:uncharacterized membrane protein